VTYAGPAGKAHRFIAVQQNHENVVRFDVTFTSAGGIAGITNVVNIPIDEDLDFEGIAYTNATRNSVFVSEENAPGVREISLANGDALQTVRIPAVFSKLRDNKGFESLTRTRDETAMWTANEEALTVDGPKASPSAASPVRLLRLDVSGDSIAAGNQYAYRVEPIHGIDDGDKARSGLSDLVAMPDGTLLSLERSFAGANPFFLNRIFEIDFANATDVSQGVLASGLDGQIYTPVGKRLLWGDSVDGTTLGQNFEGLGLGPQLANGAWALIGVVDGGGNGSNTVVSFTATANHDADFDRDGDVDGNDFLTWQRGVGKKVGAKQSEGDADRDGDVDVEDLNVLRAKQPAPPATAAPEPSSGAMLVPGLILLRSLQRPC
jgi:hypothetical protein